MSSSMRRSELRRSKERGTNTASWRRVAVALILCSCTAATDQVPKLRAIQTLRIRGDSFPLLPFDAVSVNSRGLIAIPQNEERRVIVVDSNGNRFSSIGTVGSGPGEIQYLRGIGWLADTLWAYDQGMRLSFFRDDGAFVRRIALREPRLTEAGKAEPAYFAMLWPVAAYSTGEGFLVRTSPTSASPRRCACWVWMDDSASVKSVAATNPIGFLYPEGPPNVAVPFAWNYEAHVSPNGARIGFVLATKSDVASGRWRLLVLSKVGDTLVNRSFSTALEVIPSATINDRVSKHAARAREAGYSPGELFSLIPRYYRPYEEIVVGDDGSSWVRLRTAPDNSVWIVTDSTGLPVGRVELPGSTRLSVVKVERTWGYEEDSLGFRHLVSYVIHR